MTEEQIEELANSLGCSLERIADAIHDGEYTDAPTALDDAIQTGLAKIADAITPVAVPGHDATGGTVISLTEAVMGITAGLVKIADALNNVAEAVREGIADRT